MMALHNPQTTGANCWFSEREKLRAVEPQTVLVASAGSSAGSDKVSLDDEDEAASHVVVLANTEWTSALEKEFIALAKKIALKQANEDDKLRLKRLQTTRRSLKNPRTGEEVIWEFKQRQITKKLVDALQDYVRFHSAESDPWASAKENVHEFHIS